MKRNYILKTLYLAAICVFISSCEEFVKIDPPRTDLIKATVFEGDATTIAAMTDIYYQMSTTGFASGNAVSVSFLASLSSDETINYFKSGVIGEAQQFNDNKLAATNSELNTNLWILPYTCIYRANAILEGLASSNGVSENLKNQCEGEAKFIRAFCHFYLVNLFGDVPLVTTTDYRVNSNLGRAKTDDVYKQIIQDLTDAQGLLTDDFSFSKGERVRANKGAATALLARACLYHSDWVNAEAQATTMINDSGLYSLLSDLTTVFVKNNAEAILQFSNVYYPNDLFTFYGFTAPPFNCALRSQFVDSFESGDNRRLNWIGSVTGDSTYYFPTKYHSFVSEAEYSTVLRLAEQYLIRAEARAQQNNIAGAQADINAIRNRAGLGNTAAGDQASLLTAIAQERKAELFTEWGHRWLDLKRTGQVDMVLSPLKSGWKSTAALYPIPQDQLLNDPAMTGAQNSGY